MKFYKMTIETILETKVHSKGGLLRKLKVNVALNVHCLCGKDFEIKELFEDPKLVTGEEHYIRPATCPSCNKKGYIDYLIYLYEGEDLCVSSSIVELSNQDTAKY